MKSSIVTVQVCYLYSQLVDNWSHFARKNHCYQKNKYSSIAIFKSLSSIIVLLLSSYVHILCAEQLLLENTSEITGVHKPFAEKAITNSRHHKQISVILFSYHTNVWQPDYVNYR